MHSVIAKVFARSLLPAGYAKPLQVIGLFCSRSLPVALTRELAEEVGLCIHVSDYLGAVEHQWIEGDRHRHQINHVFTALLSKMDTLPTVESREDHLEFFWVRPSELSHRNLMPSSLIELVQHLLSGDRTTFWGSTFSVKARLGLTHSPPKSPNSGGL
mgnify:CR=1 FL=1